MADDKHINERAYHLWEKAGRPHGRHDEFWHQAHEEAKQHEGAHAKVEPAPAKAPANAKPPAGAKPAAAVAAKPAAAAKPVAASPEKAAVAPAKKSEKPKAVPKKK